MILWRYCYSDTHTMGRLCFDGQILNTIERPWRPGAPGGLPFVSCVPDGVYRLLSHVRPNGDRVLALRNPDLGVYYSTGSMPAEGGRSLILIHAANYVEEVQGCIAPGLNSTIVDNRPMVTRSRQAMRLIMDFVESTGQDVIQIRPSLGATG